MQEQKFCHSDQREKKSATLCFCFFPHSSSQLCIATLQVRLGRVTTFAL